MDIDIYQQCPCYSGKKIKFCCGKDIVTDLNQIVAKYQSNQSLSALDQIESVIARSGERDCLLTLQTHILFLLGKTEQAKEVNQKFAAHNPRHPIALQYEAMSILAEGNIRAAIDRLQDAMDVLKSNEIPITMAMAFRTVGSVLLQTGQIIAARAHLQFALLIRGEGNAEVEEQLIYQSFRVPGAPLVFKTEFRLEATPEGKEWSGKYENVIRAVNRGQFRLGLRILERIDVEWPDQKEVVRSIAVACSMLALNERIDDAWRRLSELDTIPRWQSVEARALSYIYAETDPADNFDNLAVEVDLSDLDQVVRTALSSNRLLEDESPDEDPDEEGPPPRHVFQILDRDRVATLENLRPSDIPSVLGELYLYGRQTDRNPRMVLWTTRNAAHGSTMEWINGLFGQFMVSEIDEQVISTTSIAEDALTWQWQIPQATTRSQHVALINEHRRHVLLEKWSNIPFSALAGLTPLQASSRPDLSIALEALLLNLEQSNALQLSDGSDIAALRQLLGMAEPEKLDAADLDESLLTPLRIRHVDPTTLSDEQLKTLFAKSFSIANTVVLKIITPEILRRDGLSVSIPRDLCFSMLAQLTDDDDEGLEFLAQARHEAKLKGNSVGMYLVQEFEFRLSRGLTDKLSSLFQTIQKQYLSDPDVEYNFRRVLAQFGLLRADGKLNLPKTGQEEVRAETESAIWTPDSVTPQTSAAGESASKIWVPGSD